MPQVTRVELLDDIEHAKGNQVEATETRIFSVGGHTYKTFLCKENADQFDADMDHWTTYADRVSSDTAKTKSARSGGGRKAKADDLSAKKRAWARSQGMEVSDRGRLPVGVDQAYYAAHPDEQPA